MRHRLCKIMKIYEKNRGTWRSQVLEKNDDDEQIKAHRKRKIKIAMSQNNKLGKRDHIKEFWSFAMFPHTCTSWSKSMTFLSLESEFDFTIYAR